MKFFACIANVSVLAGMLFPTGNLATAQVINEAQAIFHGDTGTEIKISIGDTSITAPSQSFACANCHGHDAGGSREGALLVPPITASALSHGSTSRPAYDMNAFYRLLSDGIKSGGHPANPVMPRYELEGKVAADLFEYLRTIDATSRTGITPHSIRVGLAKDSLTAPFLSDFQAGFSIALAGQRPWGRSVEIEIVADDKIDEWHFDHDGYFIFVGPVSKLSSWREKLLSRLTPVLTAVGPVPDASNYFARHLCATTDAAANLAREASVDSLVVGLVEQIGINTDTYLKEGQSVVMIDMCGAAEDALYPSEIEGRSQKLGFLTGQVVLEALLRSGRNLTRARFLHALDRNPLDVAGLRLHLGSKDTSGGMTPHVMPLNPKRKLERN